MPPSTSLICHDVYGDSHEVQASSLQWRPATYGIILKDKKVLLLRQFDNKHDLPGGGVELGEDPTQAVLREIKEETGLTVSNPVSLGVASSLFRASHSSGRCYHSLLLYYHCKLIGGDLSTEGMEEIEKTYITGPEWVDVDRLDDIVVGSTVDFRPYVKIAVEQSSIVP